MKNIAILHDHFLYSWWWERLVTLLAKWLKADLFTWFFNPDSLDPSSLWFTWKFKALTKPILKQGLRHFKMMYVFETKTRFLDKYKSVVLSWNCIEAVSNLKKAKSIYYCHTPPRYLYDKYEHHLKQKKWLKRFLFKIIVPILKKKYLNNLSKVDKIIVNSKYVQQRLKNFTWYDSIIVYPPVDTSAFLPWKSEWYFLSFARLTDIKRVDMIAKAFTKMPKQNLVIIYNPSDPYLKTIKSIIVWHKNIRLIKAKWSQISWWLSRCKASIYIPQDEDFWMSPIESMSAWKPVIWVKEGWLKETIIDWKTWILLDSQFDINDICTAVSSMTQDKCSAMKDDCITRAKNFDLTKFISNMNKIITNL